MKKLTYLLLFFFIFSSYIFPQDFYIDEWKNRNFAISPDSKYLAYITDDNYIRIFDINNKNYFKKEIKHESIDYGSSLHFSPDGKFLTWNGYGHITFYEINTGKIETKKSKIFEADGFNFNFSPVNNLIVFCTHCGSSNAKYYLLDIKTLFVLNSFDNSWNNWDENISSDGNLITTCGEGKINLYSFFPNISKKTISLKQSYANSYAVSNNFNLVAAFNETMNIANYSDLSINSFDLKKDIGNVFNICFSPLDQNLIYANNDKIMVSDLYGNSLTSMNFEQPKKLSFTPNGKYLISLGYFGIKLWDAKKFLNYISYFTKYYDMYFKDYQNELNAVFDKSKSKDEFETQGEYIARIISAFDLKKSVDEKYNSLFQSLIKNDIDKLNAEFDKKNSEIQNKIDKSIEPVETKISSVGTYSIESELLPITINGITENIKIKRDEAKSLKENFSAAIVKGKKRLKYDLKNYEFFDLTIIHPISKTEYKFGNW